MLKICYLIFKVNIAIATKMMVMIQNLMVIFTS